MLEVTLIPHCRMSEREKKGYFLLLDAESAKKDRVGVFESELLHYSPKSCLQFYYYVDPEGTQADLSVQYAWRGKPFRRVPVLAKERSEGWQLFQSVQSGLPVTYNIRIFGYPGRDDASDIAIDDIEVFDGECAESIPQRDASTGSLCDFEGDGFCGFKVDSTGGGQWRMARGSEQYSDHTFGGSHGGHFLLLHLNEQKPKQSPPYVASLVLPEQSPTKARCLTLWYFVDGTGVGHLNISIRAPGSTASALQDMLFGVPSTGWRYGSATVMSASRHEVLLTAEVEQGGSVAVGLDDISLREGQCPEIGHCDFEGPDMCGWENAGSDVQRMWVRNRGFTPNSSSGPLADHTLGTRDGTYVYLDGRTKSAEETYTGVLKSQRWIGGSPYCFSFWLHMGGTDVGPSTSALRVIVVYVNEYGKEKREPVIVVTGRQGMRWQQKKVTIDLVSSPSMEFEVLIVGKTGGSQGGQIAIDDININHGACHESLETQFHCHDGVTVVNVSQVCDFKEDCPINGDDEQLCGTV
ncbi:hypothetical protein MTO96_009699 [Rhipicephalus appendiculatus]